MVLTATEDDVSLGTLNLMVPSLSEAGYDSGIGGVTCVL